MGFARVIVLDTHIVIWLAEAPELLSAAATEAIKSERQTGLLAISDMTLLELARLISSGKVEVRTSMSAFLQRVEQSFKVLPVTGAIAEQTMMFSAAYPRDPVDRVIGATALTHGCKLITKDKTIRESGEVRCVW
jgi:PIN domain nuclease of toxin-antitoxin system